MKFMVIFTWEPNKRDEVMKRRAEWEYPEEAKCLGEWIDLAGGRTFLVMDVDDPSYMLRASMVWNDIGKSEITPIMEGEELKKVLEEKQG